jgi:hypothetical protein
MAVEEERRRLEAAEVRPLGCGQGRGKWRRNKVATRNEEAGQTHAQKEEEHTVASAEYVIRWSSEVTRISTDR